MITSLSFFHIITGPPNSVNADPIDSTSILLNWTQPVFDSQNSSIITKYGIWCVSTEGDTVRDVAISSDQLEYRVNSLEPYSNYTCCLRALTTIGNSSSSCASALTMEDSEKTIIIFIVSSLESL